MYQHFILRTKAGEVGYYVDPAMYYTMNRVPGQMAKFIADSITHELNKHLK